MRAALLLVAIAPACVRPTGVGVELPPEAKSILYVVFRQDTPIAAFGLEPGAPLGIVREPTDVTAVLGYTETFAELGITLDERHRWAFISDEDRDVSAPLPVPAQWLEISGDEATVVPTGENFRDRFRATRIDLGPCPTLGSQTAASQIDISRHGGIVASLSRLGDDGLVVGISQSDASPTVLRVSGADEVDVLDAGEDWYDPRSVRLPNGHVRYMVAKGKLLERMQRAVSCDVGPGSAEPACSDVELDPPFPRGIVLRPTGIIGQVVGGVFEMLALHDATNTLYIARGEGPWRPLLTLPIPANEGEICPGIGVQTLALMHVGEREAVVGFRSSLIVRVRYGATETATATALIGELGPACRSQYGRFPDGSEIVIAQRSKKDLTSSEPSPTFFWRRAGGAEWTEIEDAGLQTRALVAVEDVLVAIQKPEHARVIALDFDRPTRPPRLCPPTEIGHSGHQALVVGSRIYFAGVSQFDAAALNWTTLVPSP